MEIDVEKVAGVADELVRSAAALTDAADSVTELSFGPAVAGRVYTDLGARIAAGYGEVEAVIRRWSEGEDDNATRLRSAVAAYTAADGGTAQSIRGVVPR